MITTVLERAKIQAQVLIPLIKALQADLGVERANALVRDALRDLYRREGDEFARKKGEKHLGKTLYSAFATYAQGDALNYEVNEASQDTFETNVTGCKYA